MFKNQFSNIIHRKFKLFWEFATLDRIEGLQIKVLIYSCFNKKWISYIHTTQTKASWTSVWYSIFCRPFDSVFILHMKWDDQSSPFPTIAIHHMDWKVLWQRVFFPGCPAFLASEMAAVAVLCHVNGPSIHWFSQVMFTGLSQNDSRTLLSDTQSHYLVYTTKVKNSYWKNDSFI